MKRVSVVGLGRLGLPLAACFASRGFHTIGVDIRPDVVDAINDGRSPLVEPRLPELIAASRERLRATLRADEAVHETDATFILVATPSRPDGGFSNDLVLRALDEVGGAIRRSGKREHLVVISSTVMPGSCDRDLIPRLETASGRIVGKGVDVCYNPDFVALGETVKGFLRPDMVLIGERTADGGAMVESLYRSMCENTPRIARMSIVSAELAKVALNAYITVKISFANALGNICERVPGADVDAITSAVGADSRISPKYFTGGLSFGGTCFPRDTHAYLAVAREVGLEGEIIAAVQRVNEYQDDRLEEVVTLAHATHGGPVAILGLAFRPDTPVTVASAGTALARRLAARGIDVCGFDPLAADEVRREFGDALPLEPSADVALGRSRVAVLTHRAAMLRDAVERWRPDQPAVLVDCWRTVDPARLHANVRWVPLGRFAPAVPADGSPR